MLKTKWNILYDIKLYHPYYLSQACRALEITPTTACKRLLRDYGLQFKTYKGGALIIGEQVSNDNGATWQWKLPVTSIAPIKFVFTLSMAKDYDTFEKVTFLDDFTAGTPPKIEIVGKTIYYFNNLDDNGITKIPLLDPITNLPTNIIELADDNAAVGKRDRVKLISEVLRATFNVATSAKLKFKKVKNAPLSETELVAINDSISLNMNDLYRSFLNIGITDENKKMFPPAPEGLYELVISATEKTKIYRDLMLANQGIWGIVEIFEDKDMKTDKTILKISFSGKDQDAKFSNLDKGEDKKGKIIYPKSEFYNYFTTHGNTPYKERIQYPDL